MKGVFRGLYLVTAGVFASAAQVYASTGSDWLTAQQNADGSYATVSDIVIPFTATTETLRTLSLLNYPQDQAISAARQYVLADEHENAEILSRKIITAVDAGQVTDGLVGKLNALQNDDGGYGDHAGYQSSVIDTAHALEAQALAGQLTSTAAADAVEFLLRQQANDGGWRNGDNFSQVFTTALSLRALVYIQGQYSVDAAMQSAVSFLISQKDASGGWGEDHLTAIALMGLVNAVADASSISDSAHLLNSHQQANGSWADDVYVTALALRALKLFELRWGSVIAEPGSVDGYVKQASSGEPIANAQVSVDGVEGASTQSNTSGYFLLSNLRPGDYTIIAGKAGYIDVATAVRVQSNQIAHVDDLVLYTEGDPNAPNTVTLQGRVLDGVNNQPIASATATNLDTGTVVSADVDGRFTLSGNTSQSFQLELKADGYATRTYTVTAPAWGEMAGTYLLSPSSDEEFATSTTLRGVITDAGTGNPIAEATIEIPGTSYSTSSNETGAYELTGIDTLDFQVKVSAFGYEQGEYSVDLEKHGTYTLDAELNPGNSENLFQIISLSTTTPPLGADEKHLFRVEVGNLTEEMQEALLIGHVYDLASESTKPVATVTPYAPGSDAPQALFEFEAREVKELIVPWETAQFPPGQYRLVMRVVEPDSIQATTPHGNVWDEKAAYAEVIETQAIKGTLAFDPPVAQAGSAQQVNLDVLFINAGNVPLTDQPFSLSIENESGDLLHEVQATLDSLNVNNNITLSFGEWVATEAGNLKVSVLSAANSVNGEVQGQLYVGDKASGSFAITPSVVPTGNQTVRATVDVRGVDKAFGLDDPLVFAITEAVRKGGEYLGTAADQWEVAHNWRCTGCHVQSQAVYGLASAQAAGIEVNQEHLNGLYNSLVTSQIGNSSFNHGSILSSGLIGGWLVQTSLAAWAFSEWPDKERSFGTKYRAGEFFYRRAQNRSGPETHWIRDNHDANSWWTPTDVQTALVMLGYVDLIKTAGEIDLSKVENQTATLVGTTGPGGIRDIEEGPDGALYLAKSSSEIVRFDPETGQSEVLAPLQSLPLGLDVTPDGTIYAGGSLGRMFTIPPGGVPEKRRIGVLDWIQDVEVGPEGYVYFSVPTYRYRKIWRMFPDGSFGTFIGENNKARVGEIEFDSEGNLYGGSDNNHNIIKISPDRTISTVARHMRRGVGGLAFRPDGTLLTSQSSLYMAIDSDGVASLLGTGPGSVSDIVHTSSGEYFSNKSDKLFTMSEVPFDESKFETYRQLVSQGANYLLNIEATEPTTNRIRLAWRLAGLAEARKVVADPSQLALINDRISELDEELRSYQLSDRGWGETPEDTSDALVTALVGLALEYEEPDITDPAVLGAIKYLLSQQQPDKSWLSANGVMNTRLGATGSVMAYLPRVLRRLGGLDVDLNIDLPANVTLSNPTEQPSASESNAEGGVDHTWTLAQLKGDGRRVEFDLALQDMDLHEERPVAVRAYLESRNSFNDDKVRVDLDIPVVRADDGLALTVDTDQGMYGANDTLAITAPVYNVGPYPQSGYVQISILSGDDGSVVAQLPVVSFSEIPSGGQTTVTSTWHTGTTVPGDYVVHAELYDQLDRHVDTAEAGFEIRGSEATSAVSLRTTTDKTVYHTTDNVDIANLIRNLTSNTSVDNARLKLEITDPDGNTSFDTEVPLEQLSPGASHQVPVTYALQDAAIGEYQVLGRILDPENTVLAEDTAGFTVRDDQTRALSGQVDAEVKEIHQGDPQTCTDTVENRGTQNYDNLELRRQVVRLDEETVARTQADTVELPAGGELTLVREFDTTDLPIGDYLCTLEARNNNDWHSLAYASFRVKEPPIRIDAEFTLGGTGRVLILLDENTAPGQGQNDPHGPQGAPDLAEQRVFLEDLLTARGFSYTIATTADAFMTELRSGAYNLYGLFAEQEKLSEQGQKELREAVYRGEGLLVAGRHDKRHKNLDDPLGVKYIGKHASAMGIEVDPSSWHSGGYESLDILDKALKADLVGSTETGRFATDGSEPGPNHAVTMHAYGQGLAVYVGYDLLAEATLDETQDTLHAELIAGALTHVQPAFTQGNAGQVAPLTLSLTNQGVEVTGQVSLSLPDGFEMIDPSEAVQDETGQWLWPFSLDEEEVETLAIWVRLPDETGLQTLEALVQVDWNGGLTDHTTATVEIEVQPRAALAEALSHPNLNDKAFKTVKQHLEKAEDWLIRGRIDKALFELTQAADALMNVEHPDAPAIRVMTGQALFDTGRLL